MLHYHGTPLTPKSKLLLMQGRNFCVPFSDGRDLSDCIRFGQSVMFDNGAFSAFTRGEKFDEDGFYAWVYPHLSHPHWAVVPDVIGGDSFQNFQLMKRWPFSKKMAMPVFHIHLEDSYLLRLIEEDFKGICFGSSGEYWDLNSPQWSRRIDHLFNVIVKHYGTMPWVHMLRAMNNASLGEWPFASADSTNVALHHSEHCCPERLARQVDVRNPPARKWKQKTNMDLFSA